MHIALITNEYPPDPHGGIGSYTYHLADGLAELGLAVSVLVVSGTTHFRYVSETPNPHRNGVRVVRLGFTAPRWLRWRPGEVRKRLCFRRELRRLHAESPFDLVECLDNHGWLPFGGIRGVPNVVRLHGATFFFDSLSGSNTSDPFTHWLERRTVRRADRLVAVSEYDRVAAAEVYAIPAGGIEVIHNAIDTKNFAPDELVRREPGLIVFANSVHLRKGIDSLVRAVPLVRRRVPQARLAILGRDTFLDEVGQPLLAGILAGLAPQDRAGIEVVGHQARDGALQKWLQRAQVCCYPSRMETFGIAPIEAMACGTPVVFSRTGPGPEVIEDGVSGLLCDPESPEDIAAKILRILEDKAFAERLGEAGRARILQRFDTEAWARRNAAYFTEVAQASR